MVSQQQWNKQKLCIGQSVTFIFLCDRRSAWECLIWESKSRLCRSSVRVRSQDSMPSCLQVWGTTKRLRNLSCAFSKIKSPAVVKSMQVLLKTQMTPTPPPLQVVRTGLCSLIPAMTQMEKKLWWMHRAWQRRVAVRREKEKTLLVVDKNDLWSRRSLPYNLPTQKRKAKISNQTLLPPPKP